MKIALVLERFDPARGGREQWTYCFAQRLAARGHEVHVVARDFSEAGRLLPLVRHTIDCDRWPMAFARAAKEMLEPLGMDIVHDMGAGWYCDVFHPHGGSQTSVAERKLLFLPAWLRPIKRPINRILGRHRRFRELMAHQYADRGQVMLALSRAVADDFRQFHDVSPERIRIVQTASTPFDFRPRGELPIARPFARLGIESGETLALIVAHNFRLKGVATLLGAMARLRGERLPMRLVVAGGKRVEAWRRCAAGMGLGRDVTFVGRIDDPAPYYAAADLYVHPTFYDPCSLVVLEAAACGLPVITSRYNGAAEAFEDGSNIQIILNPADSEELAAAMRAMMDPRLRERLGDAARKAMLAQSFERNVDQIVDIYREIVRRRAARRDGDLVWTARVQGETTDTEISRELESVPRLRTERLPRVPLDSGVPS